MPRAPAIVLLLLTTRALATPHADANGVLIRGPESCGTRQVATPGAEDATFIANPVTMVRTIYLNKNGGTYSVKAGNVTNAATNTASTIAAGDGAQHLNTVIPPIDSVFNWPYIVTCVKAHYKPYNVSITETEPTSGNYVEAVVGGTGASMGWSSSSGILGVASADNFCGVTEKGIAFSFSTNHIGIQKMDDELCATIAHEVGHLLSLEHEVLGADTMSYVPFATSMVKSFVSGSQKCGTDDQHLNSCQCQTSGAGEVTNSASRLTQYLGLRPVETTPPTLNVDSPGKDNTLPPSFSVVAEATDDTAMDQVAVLLNGTMMASSSSPTNTTYTVALTNVPLGAYTLEVQAIDLACNITKQDIPVTIALGATGESCVNGTDCTGSVCAQNVDGSQFCTQACDPSNSCPDGFACSMVGAQNLCTPDGGGCCAVSPGGDSRAALLLGLGVAAVLMRRRRR
jgi:hypothetical protein